jgi:type IV secretory pathway VirD2 relaxase
VIAMTGRVARAVAPLAKHVAYFKHGGVTQDGHGARMFDAASDHAGAKAFAERCEGDQYLLRFTVSPEEATQMGLYSFTREAHDQG